MHRPANVFRLSFTSKAMAYFLGICLHLLHICLRMDRMQPTAECNCSWQDLPSVDADGAWIDWVSSPLLTYDGFIYGCRRILDA
jgi:hypothetical protein